MTAVAGPAAAVTLPGLSLRDPVSTHQPPLSSFLPGPLAVTLTRIVGVVPGWAWALIALAAVLALLFGARAALLGARARRLERQRRELLDNVGLLQSALLPEAVAGVVGIATSASYCPAEGPGAGGDFYDVFALDDQRVGVVVGDIAGHGREALPATAHVRFTLRAYLEAGLAPRDALATAGPVLARQLPRGLLVTALVAVCERERFVYASAGHPPPLIDGVEFEPVTVSSSPPLGAGWMTGRRQTAVALAPGATICVHTDGIPEARTGDEFYGRERLAKLLAGLGPDDRAPVVLERVREQTTRRPDDMVACLLRIAGERAAQPAPAATTELLEVDRDDLAGNRITAFLAACGLAQEQFGAVLAELRDTVDRQGAALLVVQRDRAETSASVRPIEVPSLANRRTRTNPGGTTPPNQEVAL